MNLRRWWDTTFAVELLLLALAAPFLYFPDRFPTWTAYAAMAGLALGWAWRRWRLGLWFRRTPADWPVFFLFLVMLPISLWAAPEPLRIQYSIPKAYVLVWSFFLFWTMVTHASRSWALAQMAIAGFIAAGMAIAVVAPLGMDWLYKYPGIDVLLNRIPAPLVGVFAGADSGFHPNQVAGTLLYVLPLLLALSVGSLLQWRLSGRRPGWPGGLLLLATGVVGGVLLLTQSRAALLGLGASLLVMGLVGQRWGRWLLAGGVVLLLLGLPFVPASLVDAIGGAPPIEAVGGTASIGFRQDVWTQAVTAVHDFPFTGLGLGTFRRIVFLLYPIQVAPTYDLGHAHNFFLQTGLDFGLPGLVALIALYPVAAVVLIQSQRHSTAGEMDRWWVIGLGGSLVAQVVYGQLDAVAMGAKTNFMYWYLLAMIFGVTNLLVRDPVPDKQKPYPMSSAKTPE